MNKHNNYVKCFLVMGITLLVIVVYLLFAPPYIHNFDIKDIYHAFMSSSNGVVQEKWAIRGDVCLWDYLNMSSMEKVMYESKDMLSDNYFIHNLMLHKTFLILNCLLGILFVGVFVFSNYLFNTSVNLTNEITNKGELQLNNHNKEYNTVGQLGLIFSLISISFCWVPVLCLIIWIIALWLSLLGLFKHPRIQSIVGSIITLLDMILIVYLANNLNAII